MRASNRRKIIKTLWTGAAILTVAVPSLANAQAAQTQLGTIEVEADGENATGPVAGYAASSSTTGSKSDIPVQDIPQAVSVIGREEIEDRGVTNKVDETLRYTPGVFAQPFGVDGDTDWIYIRGFDATQTGVFLDGLNLWSYGFGGFQMDPFFLERVEVLKGPASVLYGGANPGGIVNMIGKRPLDEQRVYTETGINNHGTAFFNFDVNDVVEEQGFSYRLTGKVDGGDTAPDGGEEFRGVIMPQVEWSPDETIKLNLYGYYSYLDQQTGTNGFFPYVGTVEPASFGTIDPGADYGEPGSDFSTIRQQMIGYELEHELDNGWKLSQNARYGHVERHENSPYSYGYYDPATGYFLEEPTGPDAYLTRLGFEHETKVDSFAIDNHLSGDFETGPLRHELLVGLDYKYYQLDSVQASSLATPISVTDPVYGTPQPANSVYLDQTLTMHQLGVYLQDQIRFGDGWIATLNGRYDVLDTKLDDHIGTGSYDSEDTALSGRAGIAYEFDNGITPYASASTFFNPVIGTTLGDPLEPEEGYQFEGGVKYEPAAINGIITASVFHIAKQNWTDTTIGISTQVGEVTSTGFEVEGKFDLNDDWKAIAAFSYQSMEITEDENGALIGKAPYLVPDLLASVWLDYTVPAGVMEGLSLGGGLRYQGESWADMANTKKVPDVVLADAAIRYQKDGWGASLNVTNLFDTEYVAGCKGTLTCGYGDGRTITLKLSKTW